MFSTCFTGRDDWKTYYSMIYGVFCETAVFRSSTHPCRVVHEETNKVEAFNWENAKNFEDIIADGIGDPSVRS